MASYRPSTSGPHEVWHVFETTALADLYHAEGKPALPPVDLLFVLALPALEDRSDRAAAAAVRLRLQPETGRAGQGLLDRLAASTSPALLGTLPAVTTLRTVWAQQYEHRAQQVVLRALRGDDGTTQLQTPHDPEARWGKQGRQTWVGDKLQVSATDDADQPHLITASALTSRVAGDSSALFAGVASPTVRKEMMTTLEQVLTLLPQLSPAERTWVLEMLESDPHVAAQRAANQAALAHLDARIAADDDEDDSWWEAFTHALDRDRLSNRLLYTDQAPNACV